MQLSSVSVFGQGHGVDIYLRWMYGSSPAGSARWYHIPSNASAVHRQVLFSANLKQKINLYGYLCNCFSKYRRYSSTPREPLCPWLRHRVTVNVIFFPETNLFFTNQCSEVMNPPAGFNLGCLILLI